MKKFNEFVNESMTEREEERKILLDIIDSYEEKNDTTIENKSDIADKLHSFMDKHGDDLDEFYDKYRQSSWEGLMMALISDFIGGPGSLDEKKNTLKSLDKERSTSEIYRWVRSGEISPEEFAELLEYI